MYNEAPPSCSNLTVVQTTSIVHTYYYVIVPSNGNIIRFIVLILCACRNPRPVTTSSLANTSVSLSLSLESQPPGPSGIDVYHLMPIVPARSGMEETTEPSLEDEGCVVPQGGGARNGGLLRTEPPAVSMMFEVPPSQDVLRHSASQDSLGFSGGSSQGKISNIRSENKSLVSCKYPLLM